MLYSVVSSDETFEEKPSLIISEAEAIRDKGLKVHISSLRKGGKRTFSVYSLTSPPISLRRSLLLFFVITCLIAAGGAVFVRFYGPWRVSTYLEYPSTNCSLVSYATSSNKNGVQCIMEVTYFDYNNVSHSGKITLTESQFNERRYTVGTIFVCFYKGSFLEDKQTLDYEYAFAKTRWFLAIVVQAVSFLFIAFIVTCTHLADNSGFTNYYRRNITYRDDEHIKINEWSGIPSNLHEHFYVLMHSYYDLESRFGAEITFSEPFDTRAKTSKAKWAASGTFLLLFGAGLLVLSAFTLHSSEVDIYGGAIFLAEYGFISLFFSVQCFKNGYSITSIDTEELAITYGVKRNKIFGSIAPLYPSSFQ